MYCCQDANMYEKVTSVISWNCPYWNNEIGLPNKVHMNLSYNSMNSNFSIKYVIQ